MNRRAARVALAALAVVALAVAAATVDSTVVTTGGGEPSVGGGGPGTAGADDDGDVGLLGERAGELSVSICVPLASDPRVIGAVLLAFLAVGAVAYRDTGSILPPLALWVAFGIPVGVVYLVLTSCNPAVPPGTAATAAVENATLLTGGSGEGGLATGTGRAVPTPTAILGLLLVLALLGAIGALVVSTGDEGEPPAPGEEPAPVEPADVAAVGRAAGAAADRIEADADVDNEVYRAWTEMTDLLSVPNREAATPAEFAAAAVDAGMARDDVAELSTLFEAVRYGGEAATPDREERAVAALRRIEAAYADGDGTDDADDGSGSGSGWRPWRGPGPGSGGNG